MNDFLTDNTTNIEELKQRASAGDSDPELVGHRRGTWGNLWCE